jgi:hypothetical protein
MCSGELFYFASFGIIKSEAGGSLQTAACSAESSSSMRDEVSGGVSPIKDLHRQGHEVSRQLSIGGAKLCTFVRLGGSGFRRLTRCSASKPLAFAELHPYNPLTGIMLRRALLIASPEMPVHRKDRSEKIVENKDRRKKDYRKMASSFKLHCLELHSACLSSASFMVQARRQWLRPIGLAVNFSSPKI